MLLRERDFRLIALSTGLSALGDEVALIALTIKVHDLTHSGPAVSALLVAGLVPLLLFAPVAGLLVDRRETVRVLLLASVLQAGAAASLALVDSLPLILVLSFVLGTGFAVSQPAIFALVPKAVGEERTTQANAQLETAKYMGWVAGPLIASSLASAGGTDLPLLLDAGTFVAVALATVSLRIRRPPGERRETGKRAEAREGFVHVARDPLLFLSFVVLGAAVLFAAIDNVAEVFFAKGVLRAGDLGYGVLVAAWLLGMVAGSMLIARRLAARHLAFGALLAAVGGGAAVTVAAAFPNFAVATVAFFSGGVANGVENVCVRSLIHHRVPDSLTGRVFAAFSGLVAATQIGATALGGALLGAVGARGSLLVAGLGGAAVGLLGLARFARLPKAARVKRVQDPARAEASEFGDDGSL